MAIIKKGVSLMETSLAPTIESLLEDMIPRLKGFIISQYHLQSSDADEIVQLTLIKAWKKIDSFRNESSFSTWLYVIAKNEAVTFINKRKKDTSVEVSTFETEDNRDSYDKLGVTETLEKTSSYIMEQKETLSIYREIIDDVLNSLSTAHSEVIQLALEQEKSYQEISDKLKIPVGTVMSRLFFARKIAKQLIIKYAKRNGLCLSSLGRCK